MRPKSPCSWTQWAIVMWVNSALVSRALIRVQTSNSCRKWRIPGHLQRSLLDFLKKSKKKLSNFFWAFAVPGHLYQSPSLSEEFRKMFATNFWVFAFWGHLYHPSRGGTRTRPRRCHHSSQCEPISFQDRQQTPPSEYLCQRCFIDDLYVPISFEDPLDI